MQANAGEDTLDALLFLGFVVEIADDGGITATQGSQTLRGKASSGTIEWADRSAMFHIKERAYIARLRARVSASGTARGATDEHSDPDTRISDMADRSAGESSEAQRHNSRRPSARSTQ